MERQLSTERYTGRKLLMTLDLKAKKGGMPHE